MSATYLLDSNVISEPLRPRPDPRVADRLQRFEGHLVTASPVWHELLFGCERLRKGIKRAAVERYLREVVIATVPILPYDSRAAAWHASERARLERAGRPPPFVDGQIAAIAKVNDCTLVTANVRDYEPFEGLVVENWREAHGR